MKSQDRGSPYIDHRLSVCGFAAMTMLLAACLSGNDSPPAASATSSAHVASGSADGPVRVGAPYTIAGRTYTPLDQADYDDVGYASWYGAELAGRPTASGEAFAPTGISAAHRTLPLPSYVEVTRLDTGRTILIRINDRGPADSDRTIDLSTGAAEQLGITELGMVPVRIRRTNPVESERAALRNGQPVAARIDTPESLLEILQQRASRLPVPAGSRIMTAVPRAVPPAASTPSPTTTAIPAASGGYMVQVAAFSSRARADALARRLGATVSTSGSLHRVRYGPFATADEAQAAVVRARSLGQPGAVTQRER